METSQVQLCLSGAGQYTEKLEETIQTHLEIFYPDFNQPGQRSYFVPDFIQPALAAAFGADDTPADDKTRNNIDGALRGSKSESNALKFLKDFGEQYPQPMFVFSDFQCNKVSKWLKNFEAEILFLESIPKIESQQIDTLIVHKRLGIIVLETKASAKRAKSCAQLNTIGEKLEKCNYFSAALTNCKPTVTLTHFYPDAYLEGAPEKCKRCSHEKLDKKVCEDQENFLRWLKKLERQQDEKEMEENAYTYEILVPRLICAQSTIYAFEFVAKTLLTQECRLNNHVAQDGQEACVWKFLNPDQLRVWCGPKWQLISGPYGSGKTILLKHKALERLKNGENVFIVAGYPLSMDYEQFFERNRTRYEKAWKIGYFPAAGNHSSAKVDNANHFALTVLHLETVLRDLSKNGPVSVFIDEVQGSRLLPFKKGISHYAFSIRLFDLDKAIRKYKPNFYWVAVEMSLRSVVDEAVSRTEVDPEFVGGPKHERMQLGISMRYTRPLFEFCDTVRDHFARCGKWGEETQASKISRLSQKKYESSGHAKLGHGVEGPPVGPPIECTRVQEALQRTVAEVERLANMKKLTELGSVSGKLGKLRFDPMKTLVALGYSGDTSYLLSMMSWLLEELKRKGIGTCFLPDYASKQDISAITIAKCCDYDFNSLEWHTVIIVSDKAYQLRTSTIPARAMIQLIWIEYKNIDWDYLEEESTKKHNEALMNLIRYYEHKLRLNLLITNQILLDNEEKDQTGVTTGDMLAYFLINIWNGTVPMKSGMIRQIIELLAKYLKIGDPKVRSSASYGLAYLAASGSLTTEMAIDSGIVQLLISSLRQADFFQQTQSAIFIAIGIMVMSGTVSDIDHMLDMDILEVISEVLWVPDDDVQKAAMWCLGNFAARIYHIDWHKSEKSMAKLIFDLFEDHAYESQNAEELAGWTLTYLTMTGSPRPIMLDAENTTLRKVFRKMAAGSQDMDVLRRKTESKLRKRIREAIDHLTVRMCDEKPEARKRTMSLDRQQTRTLLGGDNGVKLRIRMLSH